MCTCSCHTDEAVWCEECCEGPESVWEALKKIAAKPDEVLATLKEDNVQVTDKVAITIYSALVTVAEIARAELGEDD